MQETTYANAEESQTKAKSKKERGVALVFALLGIMMLSMLAATLLSVTQQDTLASFSYMKQTQGSYASMSGVQRSVDWFSTVYGPWLNPAGADTPVSPTEYVLSPTAPPQYLSGDVFLAGAVTNFPDSAKVGEFETMRTTINSLDLGTTTVSYTIPQAKLLSHERYMAVDGINERVVERWEVSVIGRASSPLGDTVVRETAIVAPAPIPIFGNAIRGGCEIQINGDLTTDSYYSSAGPMAPPNNQFTGPDAGASVASNSYVGASGSSGEINGDLIYGEPDPGPPSCSGTESVTDSIVAGDIYEAPGIPYPPISPTFTTGGAAPDDCPGGGSSVHAITPNGPATNNYHNCRLTGSESLELRVPVGTDTPARFFINGINQQAGTVVRVTDSAGNPCPPATDPPATLCAPIQLYVLEVFKLSGGGIVGGVPGDPTRFTVFYAGTADFYGTIYAPNAELILQGNVIIYGAVTAKNVTAQGNPTVHYDLDLARIDGFHNTVPGGESDPLRILSMGKKQ